MTTRVFRDRNLTNVHVSESLFLPTELGNVTPAGKIAFNTSTNLLSFSDGHNWVDITNSGGTVTLSSVGTGSSLVAGGAGPNLSNKSLVAGTGITLNSTADEVTINSSNSGAITLASTGGDQSLVSNGTGPNLTTKGLTAGTGIELTSTSSAVTIDILTYDAVVSAGGEPGTYPLLSSAISAGKKTIFIKNGTYIETSQIQLNAGTVIVGENSTNVIIYGSGLSSALVTNIIPSGSTQSAGTISINNNSTTVTGSGTSFTNLVAGQSILIASVYYTIASIASNTSLTLTTAYKGTAVSGSNYVATSVAKEIRIYNLSLVNYPSNPSTGAGFSFQQIQALRLSGILAIGFNYNYYFSLCSAVLITHSLSQNSLSDGMYFVDSFNCQVAATGNANGSGNGLTITSNLYQSFEFTLESCFYNNNNNYGISIGGTSMIINCSDSIIVHNKQGGIRCTNGTSRISLGQCNIKHCGVGVSHSGSFNTITSCTITDCTSDGIDTGNEAMVVGNTVSNNAGVGINMQSDSDIAVTGNIIQNNSSHGISISGNTQESTITGNVIYNNGGNGINIGGNASGSNTISSNSVANNTNSGIYLQSDNNVVVGNRCHQNGVNGVQITSTASNTIVSSNNLSGNTGTSLVNNGTGTVNSVNVV